jgi:hypothetical protein
VHRDFDFAHVGNLMSTRLNNGDGRVHVDSSNIPEFFTCGHSYASRLLGGGDSAPLASQCRPTANVSYLEVCLGAGQPQRDLSPHMHSDSHSTYVSPGIHSHIHAAMGSWAALGLPNQGPAVGGGHSQRWMRQWEMDLSPSPVTWPAVEKHSISIDQVPFQR